MLVDGNGKLVGRRLSGSFVAKAVKTSRKSLDEVEDGTIDAFLKEMEDEGCVRTDARYHTYDRADSNLEEDDESGSADRYTAYDRLIHLPAARTSSGPRGEGGNNKQLVLDLRQTRKKKREF